MLCLKNKKGRVFVGISGGVDSAVSAALLVHEGYDVTGVFIRIALPGYTCTADVDKIEAMRVSAHLRIPFLEIDLSSEYENKVFETSLAEFAQGRTPNPDVLCNREIKFGAFYTFAKSHGADFIATGHYAQVGKVSRKKVRWGRAIFPSRKNGDKAFLMESFAHLHISTDTEKDQSYFLWMVPETVLGYVLFPIGGMHKFEVRTLAKKFGLPNAGRKDSQGLCFLGDIAIEDVLHHEIAPRQGNVLLENGEVIGVHNGTVLYTLGQRHGFEFFANTPKTEPHFVIAKDVKENTITVSTERYPKHATRTEVTLSEVNWIGNATSGSCLARYRYRQKLISAELYLGSVPISSDPKLLVVLHEPHYIPEGQSLVLYRGDRCLGGGIIQRCRYE